MRCITLLVNLAPQRRLTADDEETDEPEAGASLAPTDEVDSSAIAAGKTVVNRAFSSSASGVAVTNYVDGASWTERPKRNLLVVIHPWCMLRKSGPDRQSEFPPPGFLERLKAKLLALHCDTDSMQPTAAVAGISNNRRRRNNNQKINYWIRYMSAITSPAAIGTRPCVKTVKTCSSAAAVRQKEPATPAARVDFLEVRRRFASIAAEFESGWPRQKIAPLQ